MTARIAKAMEHVDTCKLKILYIDVQRETKFGHGTYYESLIER